LKYLRPEQEIFFLNELSNQIKLDSQKSRRYFGAMKK